VNPCFWGKNGGWYVNMRGLGKIDKNNVQKNAEKRGKSEQK